MFYRSPPRSSKPQPSTSKSYSGIFTGGASAAAASNNNDGYDFEVYTADHDRRRGAGYVLWRVSMHVVMLSRSYNALSNLPAYLTPNLMPHTYLHLHTRSRLSPTRASYSGPAKSGKVSVERHTTSSSLTALPKDADAMTKAAGVFAYVYAY